MKQIKINKETKRILSALTAIITLLGHIAVLAVVFLSYRYFGLQKQLALGMLAAVLLLLIILDIVFYVGFSLRDNRLKILNVVLASFILIFSLVAALYLRRVNRAVSQVLENSEAEQFENIYVTLVTNSAKIKDLKDVQGKRFGMVSSNQPTGIGNLAKEELTKAGVTANFIEYKNANELLLALFNKEVDVASLQSSYRSMYKDEKGYAEHLAELSDFYSFSKKVQTGENKSAKADLSTTPFNILLIGFAPEPGGTSGLADSIIVASVNPKTMTVSLSSIARDTYAPISCWGGAKDKINSARSESRACLMETVGDLLHTPIDFYMEVNFKGVVDIVDALGGIWIDSPVEFVGQDSGYERGNTTVWINKGGQMVNGEQALAFARERYAMPNGDFDRQQHQKEVIAQIVERLLATKDVNQALKVMDAAGDNLSTNLSLSQLTNIFNFILQNGNGTGLTSFQTIDMQNLRITGYPSWHYNEAARLPLWIYKPYRGSIAETKARMSDVLGQYAPSDIKQKTYFKFFAEYPYSRAPLYSEFFNEAQEHEEMPTFYPDLTTMSLAEAQAWATANGVSLEINYISEGDAGYDANSIGRVLSQDVKYGELTRNFPVVHITVMGKPLAAEDMVPNFVGKTLSDVEDWANANGYVLHVQNVEDGDYGLVQSQSVAAGTDKKKQNEITVHVRDFPTLDVAALVSGKTAGQAYDALHNAGFIHIVVVGDTEGWRERELLAYSPQEAKLNQTITLTVEAAADPTPTPTPKPTDETTPNPGETEEPATPENTEETNP